MKDISSPDFDIYNTNSYLHFCVIEHIRLFNTNNINIQRTSKYDMKYYGIELKKGQQLFILLSNILRDNKLFHNPDKFIPERWENKNVTEQDIVFGIGPQICPSKKISPILYKAIIIKLLTYKLKCVYPILKSKQIYYINPHSIRFSI